MKKIMTFALAVVAAVFVFLGTANAQENNNRDAEGKVVRGPYLTNDALSNLFIGVGGGVNTTFAKGVVPFSEFSMPNNWAADVFVGKWFTPTIGVRIGYNGIMNNFGYDTDKYVSKAYANGQRFRMDYAHADFMWNMSNAIGGYKETRFYDVIPYAGAGYLGVTNKSTDNKLAVNAGIYNRFRLNEVISLFLDLGMAVTENPARLCYAADNKPVVNSNVPLIQRPLAIPSATFGITFSIGNRKNFDRYSSVAPVAVPFTVEQFNELRDKVFGLEDECSDLRYKLEICQASQPDTVYVKGATKVLIGSTVITFAIGSYELTDVEREKVEMFARTFSDGDILIQVVGSADSMTGSERKNADLSRKRAEVVRDVLVKNGIDESRLVLDSTFDATDDPETSRSAIITLTVE